MSTFRLYFRELFGCIRNTTQRLGGYTVRTSIALFPNVTLKNACYASYILWQNQWSAFFTGLMIAGTVFVDRLIGPLFSWQSYTLGNLFTNFIDMLRENDYDSFFCLIDLTITTSDWQEGGNGLRTEIIINLIRPIIWFSYRLLYIMLLLSY